MVKLSGIHRDGAQQRSEIDLRGNYGTAPAYLECHPGCTSLQIQEAVAGSPGRCSLAGSLLYNVTRAVSPLSAAERASFFCICTVPGVVGWVSVINGCGCKTSEGRRGEARRSGSTALASLRAVLQRLRSHGVLLTDMRPGPGARRGDAASSQ
ncbi:hypothetical protein AAFF_G00106410 [Aldrovandia affinis]|uniref:Uncharacterized protein n=1 Tax=Aldrovandia affinis TaxID=143900 RepID=A0AAD7T265_9TELE|nr:hypothetical protein AAFF_G00106410 [Aldrovandia affinis]